MSPSQPAAPGRTASHPSASDTDPAAFAAAWRAWHAAHERALADPHGFLAITGLHWLDATPQRFDDAPGAWSTGPGGPVVDLRADESVVVDGTEATGTRHAFGPVPERGQVEAVSGDTVLEVARRGGHDVLRPRHPDHALRRAFHGVPSYAPDPAWRVTGRFVPFAGPREVTVGAAVDGLTHVYTAPGRIEFEAAGRRLALTAFNGHGPGGLFVLFTDATSGITTYAANRSLTVRAPGEDGTVALDFNRAVNLPCAYTDFATCPLPPPENHLDVAVEAGERIPHERS